MPDKSLTSQHSLDKFEQTVLDSVENDEWQSKGHFKQRLAELQSLLKN